MRTVPSKSDAPPLAYQYTTWEKQRRRVLVGLDAIAHTGVWSVYDVPSGSDAGPGWLVERLNGHDEKLDAAAALACDYSSEQQRFHDGERSQQALPDPLPKPTEVPVGRIRKHAARARRVSLAAAVKTTALAA